MYFLFFFILLEFHIFYHRSIFNLAWNKQSLTMCKSIFQEWAKVVNFCAVIPLTFYSYIEQFMVLIWKMLIILTLLHIIFLIRMHRKGTLKT